MKNQKKLANRMMAQLERRTGKEEAEIMKFITVTSVENKVGNFINAMNEEDIEITWNERGDRLVNFIMELWNENDKYME